MLGLAYALAKLETGRWVCVEGEWVAEGRPSAPRPTEGCGSSQEEDERAAWEVGQQQKESLRTFAWEALGYLRGEDPAGYELELPEVVEEKYAYGSYTKIATGEESQYYLAKNAEGEWILVAEGEVSCESLSEFPDYPTAVIGECVGAGGGIRVR